MSILINNLILKLDDSKNELKKKVAKELRISINDIKEFKVVRESLDARRKTDIKFNCSVKISCDNEEKIVKKINKNNIKIDNEKYDIHNINFGENKLNSRPVIIGMGPAGMFAGLIMAQNGYKPIIIERGQKVEQRSKSVDSFWDTGKLNVESNVQFGEGGAGTFSDGKLTTRTKDIRCDFILKEFVKSGAPNEILYMAKPHIGTDILKDVVKNIREEIIKLGGDIYFDTKLEKLIIKDGKIRGIVANGSEIESENVILSIGHSSRDTYEMLHKIGVFMESKPFAIGVRIENLQNIINESQYGEYANHPRLKAAEYRLTHTSKTNNRGVYSFCMCPGGTVVAAASEENAVVTNGMSYYKRDKQNANSAIVVSVDSKDFGGDSPLKAIEFQRHYEKLAYKVGGGNYKAPVQLVEDFLQDRISTNFGDVKPTYTAGYEFGKLNECLPKAVVDTLKEGLLVFDKKIKGFAHNGAILTGIETRTSAPIRITRNKELESISIKGLYPCGEGAGYAGGIISSAVDGIKCAEKIMEKWAPILK